MWQTMAESQKFAISAIKRDGAIMADIGLH